MSKSDTSKFTKSQKSRIEKEIHTLRIKISELRHKKYNDDPSNRRALLSTLKRTLKDKESLYIKCVLYCISTP